MSPKNSKDSSLLWLRVYVRLHLIGRTMIDLVLNEKILDLDMLSLLGTACPPVGLEQDSTHVVLVVEQQWIHAVSLLLHKVANPEDIPQQVVHPNQLELCQSLHVDLLLPEITEGYSLAEAHPRPPCMPPTVPVHSICCIHPPLCECQQVCQQYEGHVQSTL